MDTMLSILVFACLIITHLIHISLGIKGYKFDMYQAITDLMVGKKPKHNLISKFSSYDALCHYAQQADDAALSGMLTVGVSTVKYLQTSDNQCVCVPGACVPGVCAWVCMHVYMYVFVYTSMYVFVCVCTCVYMYVCAWCRCVNATNTACPTI